MLSNNIEHDKHAAQEILLETSMVVTSFVKIVVGKSLSHALGSLFIWACAV